MMSFAVIYPSLFNTKPVRTLDTWLDLVAMLQDHLPSKSKKSQALYSPVSLCSGGSRSNESVQQVNALVIDVDGGTEYEAAKAALVGRQWVAYSSFSHTQDEPHFHIVVRLDEPVAASQWHDAYAALKAEMGGLGDHLSAPCHAYFLPQHQLGSTYFVEVSK
jgi:hypothetical protein